MNREAQEKANYEHSHRQEQSPHYERVWDAQEKANYEHSHRRDQARHYRRVGESSGTRNILLTVLVALSLVQVAFYFLWEMRYQKAIDNLEKVSEQWTDSGIFD